MESDGQSNDLKLLLLDASIIKDSLLVETVELLLELGLDLDNLIADALQVDEPLLTLLLDRVLESLLELLQALLLVLVHFFLRLVHPILTHQLLIELVLFLLHNEFVATQHPLETTHTNVVTLHQSLFLGSLPLSFFHFRALFRIIISLNSDFSLFIDLEDVVWSFGEISLEFFENNGLLKTLKKVTNLLLLLADSKFVLSLLLLKVGELLVEVTLELKDDLL